MGPPVHWLPGEVSACSVLSLMGFTLNTPKIALLTIFTQEYDWVKPALRFAKQSRLDQEGPMFWPCLLISPNFCFFSWQTKRTVLALLSAFSQSKVQRKSYMGKHLPAIWTEGSLAVNLGNAVREGQGMLIETHPLPHLPTSHVLM